MRFRFIAAEKAHHSLSLLCRCLRVNPSLVVAHVWYSQYLGAMGRLEEARMQSEAALRLNPAAPDTRTHAALSAWQAGRVAEAMGQWQQVKDLDPHYWGARHFLARGFIKQGLYTQAVAELQEVQRLEGDLRVATLSLLAFAYARCGKRTEAQQIVSALEQGASTQFSAYHMALAYIGIGDHDLAFASLEKGYERRGEGLFFLNAEPLFEPLYADRRYANLIRRIGLPADSLPNPQDSWSWEPAASR